MKFTNKAGKGEIIIYEDIGDMWAGVTAKSFAEDLANLGRVNEIDVRLNSGGGNVFDGIAIYNRLKSHEAKINIHIDGLAASIASVVAMAGDTIEMAENAFMMIHDPWVMTAGNADELRKTADDMDNVKGSILASYMTRVNIDEKEVSDLMQVETWMNSEEALEKGFIHEVTGEQAIAAHCDLNRFRNAPAELSAKIDRNANVKQTLAKMSNVLRKRKLGAI